MYACRCQSHNLKPLVCCWKRSLPLAVQFSEWVELSKEKNKSKTPVWPVLCLHSSVLTALLVSLIEWRLVWTHSCRISVFVRSFAFVDVWVYIFSPTKATKGATTGGLLVVESLMCTGLYPLSSSLFLHSWLFLLSSSILSTASLSPSSTLTLSEWPEWPAPSHVFSCSASDAEHTH